MSLRKSPQLTPALFDAARHNAQHFTGPRSPCAQQNSKLNAPKTKDRHGNVYENKGLSWSSPAQSGNLIENKYSYQQNAGMLLKAKEIDRRSQAVEGRW